MADTRQPTVVASLSKASQSLRMWPAFWTECHLCVPPQNHPKNEDEWGELHVLNLVVENGHGASLLTVLIHPYSNMFHGFIMFQWVLQDSNDSNHRTRGFETGITMETWTEDMF